LWGILYLIILWLAEFNSDKISPGFAFCVYFYIVINHYMIHDRYSRWKESESEFDREFCYQWRPNTLFYFILFWVGLKFGNTIELIFLMTIAYALELWDRRFITSDIKQDMILKELKRFTKLN
jgi:hypothetical protein